MERFEGTNARLATAALACSALAFPLWLLSYSWIPFEFVAQPAEAVRYIILIGEAGALLAAILGIGLGFLVRRRARAGSTQHRRASRALLVGAVALVLVVGLNIVGAVVFA